MEKIKKRLGQQSTWAGLGVIGFAIYRAVFAGDFTMIGEACVTGAGLIAVDA